MTATSFLGSDRGKLQFFSPATIDLQLANVQMNPFALGACFLPKEAIPLIGPGAKLNGGAPIDWGHDGPAIYGFVPTNGPWIPVRPIPPPTGKNDLFPHVWIVDTRGQGPTVMGQERPEPLEARAACFNVTGKKRQEWTRLPPYLERFPLFADLQMVLFMGAQIDAANQCLDNPDCEFIPSPIPTAGTHYLPTMVPVLPTMPYFTHGHNSLVRLYAVDYVGFAITEYPCVPARGGRRPPPRLPEELLGRLMRNMRDAKNVVERSYQPAPNPQGPSNQGPPPGLPGGNVVIAIGFGAMLAEVYGRAGKQGGGASELDWQMQGGGGRTHSR